VAAHSPMLSSTRHIRHIRPLQHIPVHHLRARTLNTVQPSTGFSKRRNSGAVGGFGWQLKRVRMCQCVNKCQHHA
jgi:hypothetical protein